MAPIALPPLGLKPALPEGWVEHVDDATAHLYYHHAKTDTTQWEVPTTQPLSPSNGVDDDCSRSVDPPEGSDKSDTPGASPGAAPSTLCDPDADVARPPAGQRKSKKKGAGGAVPTLKRNKDYVALARAYALEKAYRVLDAEPTCVMCHSQPCHDVIFPCEHKCVCRGCLVLNGIGESRDEGKWCLCPLCCGEIKRILPHDGSEVDKYWKWVLEVRPHLPPKFEQRFEFSGAYLRQPPDADSAGARRNRPEASFDHLARRNHSCACAVM